MDAELKAEFQENGFFTLTDVDLVNIDEPSNGWGLMEWTAERLFAMNLFKRVWIGDDEDDAKQYPHAVVVPGPLDPVEATNRSDDNPYTIMVLIRTIGPKMVAGKRMSVMRNKAVKMLRRKPTIEPFELPERGSELMNTFVKSAGVTFGRRADNEWETLITIEYVVREPRHSEDLFDEGG